MSDFNLGTVTAYGYAKDKGYTGTEDEFAALMASYADVAEQAAESATQAAASATTASTKASEAAASATAAASSKTAAETAQGGAETAAQTATTKAGEATTAATTATNKATEATTAATTATGKATEAAGSATTATTKAGEASTSATNAAASATRAQEILDSIPEDYSQLSDDVSDLKDGLEHKVDLPYIITKEPITILNGYFTAGGYTANSSFKSAKESVTEGETIYVSGSGTTYTYAYYFVNNSGTVISQAQTALEMDDYELVVPTGATYIEINSTGTNKSIAVKRGAYADSFIVGVDVVDFVNYSKQYLDSTMANVGRYWNNGSMAYVADDKWIAFDAFTLPAGTYYSYNIGHIYKKVGNTISEITKTDINGIPYLHTWSLAEESLIMINAVYGVERNSVVVGDTLNLPKTNVLNYYNVRFKKNVLPSNIVVVNKNGNGDYTEIQDAIDSIYTDTEDNPFTILVMPGEYGKIDMHRRGSQVHDLRYISIIGTDRDRCIISDDKGNYSNPTANIRTNGVIRNLSFINTTGNYDPTPTQEHAYAVHEDFGVCDVTYENCYMYCEAGPAIGIGMADGKRMRFLNCEFICNENEGEKKGLIGAFFAHSANDGSNDQSIEIKNSIAVNKVNTKGFCIANNVENSILDVQLIGNVSVGTSGANAYFEGHIDFGYSALNNFEIPT